MTEESLNKFWESLSFEYRKALIDLASFGADESNPSWYDEPGFSISRDDFVRLEKMIDEIRK